MKKIRLILIIITLLLLNIDNVFAKDTVYSINKYEDEKLIYIEDSYDKDNKVDGLITAGTYLKEKIEKEDTTYEDYQIMIVKYKKSGNREWTYRYGKTSAEEVSNILYTYNNDNKVDGYLIIVDNSYDLETETTGRSLFIKIDLDGRLVEEKAINLNKDEKIIKLITTYNSENNIDGYIGITSTSIIKFDKNLNIVLRKDLDNSKYIDITSIYKDNKAISYVLLKQSEQDNKKNVELVKYNKDLTEEKNISIDNYISYKLESTKEGFILYGITGDVKVEGGDKSYYLLNYNENLEVNWETIGNIALNEKNDIVLHPMIKENSTNYYLLYKNKDSSYEVIKLDKNGTLKKKIKKIKNSYYNFISFSMGAKEKDMYFVGYITCPKDEKCDYNSNSLFLVSDEDKVIEVKDSTSTKILIGIAVLVLGSGYILYATRKKKINKK